MCLKRRLVSGTISSACRYQIMATLEVPAIRSPNHNYYISTLVCVFGLYTHPASSYDILSFLPGSKVPSPVSVLSLYLGLNLAS